MVQINLMKKASSILTMLTYGKKKTNQKKEDVNLITYRIPLDGRFTGLYLTRRESECVFYAIHNHTIKKTGSFLDLSPRTIEFYLKRIREKLNCRSKKDLVRAMKGTSFLALYKQHRYACKKIPN